MSDIIIELGSDKWTKTEAGWYREYIKVSGDVVYDGIPDQTERRLLEEIARLRAESDANRREAESNGRFELRFVEELDAIKAVVKFEETADSDGPITLVQWCGRMAAEIEHLRASLEDFKELAEKCCRVRDERNAEIARLRAQHEADDKRLIDAAKGAQRRLALVAQLQRLTECDLQSIDWDERTITLRYPAEIDGLEVRAGLKIRADLTPMQPAAETESPVTDQTSIL